MLKSIGRNFSEQFLLSDFDFKTLSKNRKRRKRIKIQIKFYKQSTQKFSKTTKKTLINPPNNQWSISFLNEWYLVNNRKENK